MTKDNKQNVAVQCKQVKTMLELAKGEIAPLLPPGLTVDRVIRVAYMTFSRTPALVKCSAHSVVRCVQSAAQLGLEIDGISNDAHMVPFWNKNINSYEAQFQIGYRGWVKLMKRHGGVSDIESRVVYKSDKFKCTYGPNGVLEHEPNWDAQNKDEDILGFYAVAYFKDKKPVHEFMPKADVDKIKKRTKSKDADGNIYASSPWVTDYSEMGRKTIVKRLCKSLTTDSTLNEAVQMDNLATMGETQSLNSTIDYIDGETGEITNKEENFGESEEAVENKQEPISKAQSIADSLDLPDNMQ